MQARQIKHVFEAMARMLKNHKKAVAIVVVLFTCIFFAVLSLFLFARTDTFKAVVSEQAEDIAEKTLGIPVKVGKISVDSSETVKVEDVALYDKEGDLIVHADEAEIHFGILAAFKKGADAVDTVRIAGVEANLVQREDGSWNTSDIDMGESKGASFHGTVELTDGTVYVHAMGKDLDVESVKGSVDFKDAPLMTIEGSAVVEDAPISAKVTYRKERQTFDITAGKADIARFLPYLPEDVLPSEVVIHGGTLKHVHAEGSYYGSVLTLVGDAALEDGKVTVLGTDVENIAVTAHFTQEEVLLTGDAEAAGQKAHASGVIHFGNGTPILDLTASSDAFDPAAILKDIPYKGAVKFTAHIAGDAANPLVEARASAARGEAYGIPFLNAKAKVRYDGSQVFVKNVYAEVFGGKLTGEVNFSPKDLKYIGHVKAEQIDAAQAAAFLPSLDNLTGRTSADLSFTGEGTDISGIHAFGSLKHIGGAFYGLPIERVNASFSMDAGDLMLDYASARLPHGTSIGVEGSIKDIAGNPTLALSVNGGHVDLSLVETLLPEAKVTGTADFSLKVEGALSAPVVDLSLVATRGKAFEQPFDDLRFHASGGLDGVTINDFSLMKDGVQRWYVDGSVGLTGEKKVDLRVDTVGVRAEDLAAIIAPEQPITGNVDNTIHITGTLDDPQAVGYIHMYRGSYNGMLLQGMDGDYFLDEKGVRLQDFHVFSPRLDFDVNGYITKAKELELSVDVHEIDFARLFQHPPYPITGKGTFAGKIGGTVDAPTFSGVLASPEIVLNDIALNKVDGLVEYRGDTVYLQNLSFLEGRIGSGDLQEERSEAERTAADEAGAADNSREKTAQAQGAGDTAEKAAAEKPRIGSGRVVVSGSYNRVTEAIGGTVNVNQTDVASIAAILNHRNKILAGTVTAKATLGGTLNNPEITSSGSLDAGSIAGYEVHDAKFSGHMKNHVAYIDKLNIQQGNSGSLMGSGTVTLDGPIDAYLTTYDIPLGLFTHAAGVDAEVSGAVDTYVHFSGTTGNPTADATLTVTNGGAYGAAFDTLKGAFRYEDGSIHVNSLRVEKTIGDKSFEATAKGTVPIRALTAGEDEVLASKDQINLQMSLDKANLALLPVLSKEIEWSLGEMKGHVAVTGTVAEPRINGYVSVTDGAMKLKPINNPITDMKAQIDFTGNTMTVNDFSGKMGNGTYRLTGVASLDGNRLDRMNFNFVADGLGVESSFFHGPIDLTASITDSDLYGRKMPKLTGQLNLHDCLISMPSIPDSDSDLPEIALDLTLNVGDHVRAYSPALYDMYLTGSAHFEGSTMYPKPSGTISVKRGGTVRYLKNVFNIREGSVMFNQVDSFLPSIDFSATTKLTRTRIFLDMKGPVGKTEIRLTSEPSMSQSEIIRLLMMRSDGRGGDSLDTESLILTGLHMSFLSEIEDRIANILHLDRFAVAVGSGSAFNTGYEEGETGKHDRDVYHLEMGKYITKDLMVKYYQGLGSNHTSRAGLQYDINDRYGITYEIEGSDQIIGFEANVKF